MVKNKNKPVFTPYELFIVTLLAFIQFTVVLDFMIMAPLGTILIDEMKISPAQFSLVVSVYAISAGVSALISSAIADNFDRKRYLLFFYSGFVIATLFCGLAPDYETLLLARIVTGLFGGVIASISLSIVADLFPYSVRGRVMGAIMAAFSVSQVLGLPLGMYLASTWNWHVPFLMIVAFSAPVGILIVRNMKPITDHLGAQRDRNAFGRMFQVLFKGRYIEAFAATALLATGGFMLMPFASTFSEHNLGLTRNQISLVYLVTGVASVFAGIFSGVLSDRIGKYSMFVVGSVIATVLVLYYTHLELTPMWIVMVVSAILFIGISARMVSAQALTSAVPDPHDRGTFMALNSSVQQLSGAVASIIAGLIVVQSSNGKLLHYEELGYVVAVAIMITAVLMYRLHLRHTRNVEQAMTVPGE